MGSSGHVVGRLPVRILETSLSLRGVREGKVRGRPLRKGREEREGNYSKIDRKKQRNKKA